MNVKNQKISLVIPVYNEADSLADCLDAIDQLNCQPFEVIVVDNNSTDHTRQIAAAHPSVRLLSEPKQGVVYARTCGFNAARGDIIARIDADTILRSDWVDRIINIFSGDDCIEAVSGRADYYDFALKNIANSVDRWARSYLTQRLGNRLFLYGANMAIRKTAWERVRDGLCLCDGLHEDLDLGIHLQEAGLRVVYDEDLIAGISPRRIGNGLAQFVNYCLASPRTYKAHSLSCRRYMYSVIAVVLSLYPAGHIVYESYDPAAGAFSFQYWLSGRLRKTRTSPTINIA